MAAFDGQCALVTGAAGGIGRGIALALAGAGATVLVSDLDEARCRDTADAIGRTGSVGGDAGSGTRARVLPADLSRPDGARALFDAALQATGRVDVLVHAASPRRQESQTALAVTPAQWDEMLDVNLRSGFLLAQAAGRHMRERAERGDGPPGRILFIASLHAHTPRNLPHYSAAKAGQTMAMKELARALGPWGIRVNAIAPGAIPGGGFAANPSLAAKVAMRRLGTPDDVARAALALLDDAYCGYVTGTTLDVDGGLALYNWLDAPG
jgi:NAD(P)-dependent dehydrogenase (short-subunit alcohol dehydrogenase family)